MSRITQYLRLCRWLFGKAISICGPSISQSAVASVLTIGLQVLAIWLTLRVLHVNWLDSFKGFDFLGEFAIAHDTLLVFLFSLLVGGLFALSAYVRYFSKTIAINIERRLTISLTSEIFSFLNNLSDINQRRFFLTHIHEDDLSRALAIGTRHCGVAVRLMTVNSINLVYLIAGLAMQFYLSPLLFFFLLFVVVIGLAMAYPLTLRAARLGKLLEVSSFSRGRLLKEKLYAAINSQPAGEFPDSEAEQEEIGFLKVVGNRLRVIEQSYFVYGLLFSLILICFIVFILQTDTLISLSPAFVLILFFAFRYTFLGLQGILVTLTSINRFLPSIVRVHDSLDFLKRAAAQPKITAKENMVDPAMLPRTIPWRVAGEDGTVQEGVLEPGNVAIVAFPKAARVPFIFQFIDSFGNEKLDHSSLLEYAKIPKVIEIAEDEDERAQWVSRVMNSCDIPADEEITREIIAGSRDDNHLWPVVIRYLGRLYDAVKRPTPLIIIDHHLLFHFSGERQKKIHEHLPDRIILYMTPWNDRFEDMLDADWLFLSDGEKISGVFRPKDMAPEDWDRAKTLYNSVESHDFPQSLLFEEL